MNTTTGKVRRLAVTELLKPDEVPLTEQFARIAKQLDSMPAPEHPREFITRDVHKRLSIAEGRIKQDRLTPGFHRNGICRWPGKLRSYDRRVRELFGQEAVAEGAGR